MNAQLNQHRLYRSRSDRVIAGIAGGMADYLEVDPTIVRILWVVAAVFTGGLAILLYIVLAFVIPINPYENPYEPAVPPAGGWAPAAAPGGWSQASGPAASSYQAGTAPTWSPDWSSQREARRAARAERPGRGGLIIGSVLIVFGLVALADVVLPGWISGALFWPALLLAGGVALLVASLGRGAGRPTAATAGSAAPPAVSTPPVGPATPAHEPASSYQPTESPTPGASEPPAPPIADAGAWESDATTTFPPQPESDRT